MSKRPVDESGISSRQSFLIWAAIFAIAALAFSLTQFIHEGTHALACIAVGSTLEEFSALHVACQSEADVQSKLVSALASLVNILVGFVAFVALRRSDQRSTGHFLFLWLFMLMNWLLGTGYWMFSGIANIGDWANVIDGWSPAIFWRIFMALLGAGTFLYFVWLSLHQLGSVIGSGTPQDQISRAIKVGLIAYCASVVVILLAGTFNPYGMGGLPAIAALMLAMGGMSPLIWMMQWFRAESFAKTSSETFEMSSHWGWIITALLAIILYSVVLGRTIYFG